MVLLNTPTGVDVVLVTDSICSIAGGTHRECSPPLNFFLEVAPTSVLLIRSASELLERCMGTRLPDEGSLEYPSNLTSRVD